MGKSVSTDNGIAGFRVERENKGGEFRNKASNLLVVKRLPAPRKYNMRPRTRMKTLMKR